MMRVQYLRRVVIPKRVAGEIGDVCDLPVSDALRLERGGYVREITRSSGSKAKAKASPKKDPPQTE